MCLLRYMLPSLLRYDTVFYETLYIYLKDITQEINNYVY